MLRACHFFCAPSSFLRLFLWIQAEIRWARWLRTDRSFQDDLLKDKAFPRSRSLPVGLVPLPFSGRLSAAHAGSPRANAQKGRQPKKKHPNPRSWGLFLSHKARGRLAKDRLGAKKQQKRSTELGGAHGACPPSKESPKGLCTCTKNSRP